MSKEFKKALIKEIKYFLTIGFEDEDKIPLNKNEINNFLSTINFDDIINKHYDSSEINPENDYYREILWNENIIQQMEEIRDNRSDK